MPEENKDEAQVRESLAALERLGITAADLQAYRAAKARVEETGKEHREAQESLRTGSVAKPAVKASPAATPTTMTVMTFKQFQAAQLAGSIRNADLNNIRIEG